MKPDCLDAAVPAPALIDVALPPAEAAAAPGSGIRRDARTWYSYLMLGFFSYLLNIQGNIVPFLRADLDLSYRAVSLHTSAVAAGLILVGLFGDRIIRGLGRRHTLWLGMIGVSAGAVILCLASTAAVSIAGCALLGAVGGLIPATVFTSLADVFGKNRNVAYSEANAVSYAFGILAPLATSLVIALAWNWRAAVLFGIALGFVIVASYGDVRFTGPAKPAMAGRAKLPRSYWAYWGAIIMVVAVEFCILVWAPAYLEEVVGLSKAGAAAGVAAFFLAVLLARIAGSGLVRVIAGRLLYLTSLAVTVAGFVLYWVSGSAVTAIAGLAVLGLGIALLYPLSLGFAVGTAGPRDDVASARVMFAVGIAILSTPALLGALADRFGLHAAHMLVPVLVVLGLGFFLTGQMLEKRDTPVPVHVT